MPIFSYTAIEAASGRERSGTLEESSSAQAVARLKARGLAPTSLTATAAAAVSDGKNLVPAKRVPRSIVVAATAKRKRPIVFGRAIDTKGLAIFTRQLATLVKAGMPLLRCLEVLGRQERNLAFRHVIEDLAEAIRSGGNFSDGLMQHPKIFDRLYLNMVKAGEAGGALAIVLERIAQFLEKAERIKGKVKSAMTYPLIVVLLAVGIVAALMVFVVPKFEQIFSGMLKGQPLPTLTRVVLGVSYFVQHHIGIAAGIAGLVYAGAVFFRKTSFGRRTLDRLWLKLPVLGDLFLKTAIARFTRTFGTLLSSGVPILEALTSTRDTSGNVHVADAIGMVHDRVKEGEDVAGPLEATGIFPGMVTSMIEVGEETGALSEMLARIADNYEEEVENAVTALTSIIEPLMIVLLALIVGTIVIALFLPIVSIIQHLQ